MKVFKCQNGEDYLLMFWLKIDDYPHYLFWLLLLLPTEIGAVLPKKFCVIITRSGIESFSFCDAVLARSTSSGNVLSVGGDLLSGRAFDNGCMCHSAAGVHRSMYNDMIGQPVSVQCHCDAPRLRAQLDFISALMNIGKRLSQLPTKDLRSKDLYLLCTRWRAVGVY